MMNLSSPAFEDGARIPPIYAMPAAGGRNTSVPVVWTNPPDGVKSYALLMVDPHPVAKNWIHWMVVNIPGSARSIAEGASRKNMPHGVSELKNSFGDVGYGGPQPPKGSGDHPYVITLYALSAEELNLPAKTDLETFRNALKGRVLAEATITGHFEQ